MLKTSFCHCRRRPSALGCSRRPSGYESLGILQTRFEPRNLRLSLQAAAERPGLLEAAERLQPGSAVEVAFAVAQWEADHGARPAQRRATLRRLVLPLCLAGASAACGYVRDSADGCSEAAHKRRHVAAGETSGQQSLILLAV